MTNADRKALSSSSPNAAPMNKPVFYISACVLIFVIGGSAIVPDVANQLFGDIQAGIIANGSWYYVLVVAVILVSACGIALTRFGDIKLGPDHSEPDYSLLSWFAMLFAAGMGIAHGQIQPPRSAPYWRAETLWRN